jgi:Zn-dependent protease with chaperone function
MGPRHDFDVVLMEGRSTKSGRVAQVLFLVEFGACIAFIIDVRLVVLFTIGAILSGQLLILTSRLRTFAGPASDDNKAQAHISLILKELCIEAQCEIPRVSVRRSSTPVALMGRKGYVALIVSPDYMEAVDDGALRAILAHEISHLRNGDVDAARQRALLIFLGSYLLGLLALLKFGNGSWPAVALFVIYLPACIRLLSLAFAHQNRPREMRADLDGARAVGDPEGMIRGLRVVYELVREIRERLYSQKVWRWLLFPWSTRARSHPSLEIRIEKLSALDQSRNGQAHAVKWTAAASPPSRRKRVRPILILSAVIVVIAIPAFWPHGQTALPGGKVWALSSTGGQQTLAMSISGGSECIWSSSPELPRFDVTVPCRSGLETRTAIFSANKSGRARLYTITINAYLRPSSSGTTQVGETWDFVQPSETKAN